MTECPPNSQYVEKPGGSLKRSESEFDDLNDILKTRETLVHKECAACSKFCAQCDGQNCISCEPDYSITGFNKCVPQDSSKKDVFIQPESYSTFKIIIIFTLISALISVTFASFYKVCRMIDVSNEKCPSQDNKKSSFSGISYNRIEADDILVVNLPHLSEIDDSDGSDV